MPSIFSRSRTSSSPDAVEYAAADEFGRVKKKKSSKLKNSTLPSPHEAPVPVPHVDLQEGAFLPANLSPPVGTGGQGEYGYLSYKRDVILALDQVARLTEVICEELGNRGGITTPFIFSSLALDISMGGIKRLIDRFLDSCRAEGRAEAEHRWREEARFAGPHELAMVLRWGLGRVVRVVAGLEVRGLVSWEHYQEFRESEAALNYPPSHFTSFLPALSPPLRSIILTTLSLLTRLTAHSATSGHTPPTLSPLFGPLLFGLGPQVGAFHHTYAYYLRATHATEHLLLAFIRWQDAPRSKTGEDFRLGPGAAAALSVPTRLKEWIKDYPATLPFISHADPHTNPQPRKGARTVRVLSVRRNVRMYTRDLVKSASSWAYRKPPSQNQGGIEPNGLIGTREWARISPPSSSGGGLAPRYADSYRKRMNLPSSYQPDASYQPSHTTYGPPSSSLDLDLFSGSTLSLVSSRGSTDTSHATAQFRSLTDLKWGEFESLGFSSPSLLSPTLSSSSSILSNSTNATSVSNSPNSGSDLEKKLQFDLTESARSYSRTSKRQTLSWNDFSSAGFSRSEAPLSTSLSFSPHLSLSLSSSSSTSSDHDKSTKLRKPFGQPSKMPIFGWDTTPVLGGEEVVEEAFVDVWCDLVWGCWGSTVSPLSVARGVDDEKALQRDLDKDCNWVLIDFKSLPPNVKSAVAKPDSDPRTSNILLLFEEFVPFEYRQELAKAYGLVPTGGLLSTGGQRMRLPSLFSSKSSKAWKQAPTLNGRPYVVGAVPASPSTRELEFEGLLRGGAATKVLTLDKDKLEREKREKPLPEGGQKPQMVVSSPLFVEPRPKVKVDPNVQRVQEKATDSPSASPSTKKSRFRIPNPGSTPKSVRPPKGALPAEYSTVDFETRFTGYSDDSDGSTPPASEDLVLSREEREAREEKMRRRKSRMNGEDDDAWVDILVGSQSRRMEGQEVDRTVRRRGRGDPDLASLEVAQALAGVRRRSSSSERNLSSDVDEIQTVPRDRQGRHQPDVPHSFAESEYAELDAEPVSMYVDDESQADYSDEGEDSVAKALREVRNKRAGGSYFDIHPDRRPISTATVGSRYTDDGSYEEEERLVYEESEEGGHSEDSHPQPPTKPTGAQAQSVRPLPIVPIPQKSSIPVPINPVPSIRQQQPQNGNGHTPDKTSAPSKTAALIEMYREKEKAGTVSPSPAGLPPLGVPVAPLVPTPAPSRLPVRNPSLPPAKEPSPTPPAKTTPPSSPPVDLEPPVPIIVDSGRASPARYVHGAPLHNVLEEEEED